MKTGETNIEVCKSIQLISDPKKYFKVFMEEVQQIHASIHDMCN